ncbi:DUF6632 domain-containing protein [Hahella sp. SMD15-11]|uniref:DUF6632 domain-containing protein n=1 Tax=Thermohahella caldifontis TaxID=3142973 RepID=A0AB39UZF8_9GAMM
MTSDSRQKFLTMALYAIGAFFIVGVPAMMMVVWPSGWSWSPAQPEYEQMIMGMYMTLGVFLVRAARNPLAHASLIWFAIWSSIVHGGIMLIQAMLDVTERANLLGDIPALFAVAGVLWYLMPGEEKAVSNGEGALKLRVS